MESCALQARVAAVDTVRHTSVLCANRLIFMGERLSFSGGSSALGELSGSQLARMRQMDAISM